MIEHFGRGGGAYGNMTHVSHKDPAGVGLTFVFGVCHDLKLRFTKPAGKGLDAGWYMVKEKQQAADRHSGMFNRPGR